MASRVFVLCASALTILATMCLIGSSDSGPTDETAQAVESTARHTPLFGYSNLPKGAIAFGFGGTISPAWTPNDSVKTGSGQIILDQPLNESGLTADERDALTVAKSFLEQDLGSDRICCSYGVSTSERHGVNTSYYHVHFMWQVTTEEGETFVAGNSVIYVSSDFRVIGRGVSM